MCSSTDKKDSILEHRNTLALEVTKQIITLSVSTIGLLIVALKTILEGHEINDFYYPTLSLTFAIISAVLAQMALIGKAQGDRKAFYIISDQTMIIVAWAFFLLGIFLTLYTLFAHNKPL